MERREEGGEEGEDGGREVGGEGEDGGGREVGGEGEEGGGDRYWISALEFRQHNQQRCESCAFAC